jgi:hypothetical protein
MSSSYGLFRRKKQDVTMNWEPGNPTPPDTVQEEYFDEDGRRHRGDAPYLLPKDEKEIQRLDYQHFLLRQALKGNCFAPVHERLSKQSAVLDVGCGTGRWGREIATDYPQARVTGLDLEDIPRSTSTPLNYQFQRGNLLTGLPFADHSFDYVHQRLLVAAIPQDKWSWVIRELKRVTRPGGWLELVEAGTTFHQPGPATTRFLEWWTAISASRSIDASNMSQLGQFLKRARLLNIQAETTIIPVGNWGGRLGKLLAQDILAGWPTMRPLAHTLLNVSPEDFDQLIARLNDEWNSYQTSYEVYSACGQVEI